MSYLKQRQIVQDVEDTHGIERTHNRKARNGNKDMDTG